jgi:phospholipid/cholesterol/gamma-HCH transport system substrate-binding protein
MSRTARLGAFILVTLAVLVSGVLIIGSKQYLFTSTYQLKAQFDDVAGLAAGGDVRVGGVHCGIVRSIELPHKPGEKITVAMDLVKSSREIIKQDSQVSIETEGMLGSQYIAISFGSVGKADVRSGDILASRPPLKMADLLAKADGILDSSQQAIENTTLATAHLGSISGKIDSGQGTVGALVNDRRLYDHLDQTTAALQGTMEQAKEGVTGFKENMEALKHNFFLRGYFNNRGYEDSGDLNDDAIEALPHDVPAKQFTLTAEQLFSKQDSAKLKNQKLLADAGEYLASNEFGLAVVMVSSGMTGDTQKELVLTQARAMVVRNYLVEHFEFDDRQLKTLGAGKTADGGAGWGIVQISIYPAGTKAPSSKQPAPLLPASPVLPQPAASKAHEDARP